MSEKTSLRVIDGAAFVDGVEVPALGGVNAFEAAVHAVAVRLLPDDGPALVLAVDEEHGETELLVHPDGHSEFAASARTVDEEEPLVSGSEFMARRVSTAEISSPWLVDSIPEPVAPRRRLRRRAAAVVPVVAAEPSGAESTAGQLDDPNGTAAPVEVAAASTSSGQSVPAPVAEPSTTEEYPGGGGEAAPVLPAEGPTVRDRAAGWVATGPTRRRVVGAIVAALVVCATVGIVLLGAGSSPEGSGTQQAQSSSSVAAETDEPQPPPQVGARPVLRPAPRTVDVAASPGVETVALTITTTRRPARAVVIVDPAGPAKTMRRVVTLDEPKVQVAFAAVPAGETTWTVSVATAKDTTGRVRVAAAPVPVVTAAPEPTYTPAPSTRDTTPTRPQPKPKPKPKRPYDPDDH